MPNKTSAQKIWQSWDFVEKKIEKETKWLYENILTFLREENNAPKGCNDCFIRRIAILIIAGKVRAKDISRSKSSMLKDFWIDYKNNKNKIENKTKIFHGSDWHKEKMKTIENHFLNLGFKVVREPVMHQGRADLGVFQKGTPNLFIEVGTTSFYKLWLNLATKGNFVYLIVPNDEKIIEFKKIKL